LSVTDSLTDEEVILDDAGKSDLYLKAGTMLDTEDIAGSDANAVINFLRQALQFDYTYGSGAYQVQYKL
jgi:hypothetical protein